MFNKSFEEVFKEIFDDGNNQFYESKEIFHSKVRRSKFGYKLIVKVTDMYDYNGSNGYYVELGMVVLPEYFDKEVLKGIIQTTCKSADEITTVDIWDYGLGIFINSESVDNGELLVELLGDDCKDVAYNIHRYLSQPWNSLGNSWYGIIEQCLYNK